MEPLPVIEFVAQILGKDVSSRPFSDSDHVKVLLDGLYCLFLVQTSPSSLTFFMQCKPGQKGP